MESVKHTLPEETGDLTEKTDTDTLAALLSALPTFLAAPLTVEPRAVRVYTDLKRDKPVVVLTYRRRDVTRDGADLLDRRIRADVASAGYVATDREGGVRLTPVRGKPGRFDFLLELDAALPDAPAGAGEAWSRVVRRVFVGQVPMVGGGDEG